MVSKRENSYYVFLRRIWPHLIILIVAFYFVYGDVLNYLIKTWNRSDYHHGFLVPLIVSYLVWVKKESLRGLPIQPSITGIFLIAAAGFILILSQISSVKVVKALTLIMMISGLVLTLLGTKYLLFLFLPIAYLLFMVPIFDQYIDDISWPLQLFSAWFASKILSYLGIPIFANMQYIEIPYSKFEVEEACSGFRYMISILAITVPLAYHTQRKAWRRLAVVLCAVSIGIILNGMRVALIVVWYYLNIGYYDAHGPLHIFQGLIVSVGGIIFIIIGTLFFREMPLSGTEKNPKKIRPQKGKINLDFNKFNRLWFLAVITLIGVGSYNLVYNPTPTKPKKDFKELPAKIENWEWVKTNSTWVYKIYGADIEVNRLYRNKFGREMILYIGHFEFQTEDKEAIYYKNRWLYRNAENVRISLDSKRSITVKKTIHSNGHAQSILLFWFDVNGRIVTNRFYCKFFSALDGFIRNRNNVTVIIVSSNVGQDRAAQSVLSDQKEFIREILPIIRTFLPS